MSNLKPFPNYQDLETRRCILRLTKIALARRAGVGVRSVDLLMCGKGGRLIGHAVLRVIEQEEAERKTRLAALATLLA